MQHVTKFINKHPIVVACRNFRTANREKNGDAFNYFWILCKNPFEILFDVF